MDFKSAASDVRFVDTTNRDWYNLYVCKKDKGYPRSGREGLKVLSVGPNMAFFIS